MRRRTLLARAAAALMSSAPVMRTVFVPAGTYVVHDGRWVRIGDVIQVVASIRFVAHRGVGNTLL